MHNSRNRTGNGAVPSFLGEQQHMPKDELLTIDEAAERVRVPVSTLRQMRYRGTGPASAIIGRRIMYRISDLDAWVADRFTVQQRRDPDQAADLDDQAKPAAPTEDGAA